MEEVLSGVTVCEVNSRHRYPFFECQELQREVLGGQGGHLRSGRSKNRTGDTHKCVWGKGKKNEGFRGSVGVLAACAAQYEYREYFLVSHSQS